MYLYFSESFACCLGAGFFRIPLGFGFGTPFRARALELGLAERGDLVMDQGGADAFLPTRTLDREHMLALKRTMIRRFYLRPSYLFRRLTSVRSLWELGAQAREGLALLRRNV